MAGIKDLLGEFTKVEGVKTAVVVGRDGFVIEGITTDASHDVEAVGAVISTGLATAEIMGKDLAVGAMSQGMLEYDNGVLLMGSLGQYALLCIVCAPGSNLGMVRVQIKKYSPLLLEEL
ncbi:roadblock/LC7 domain-containing protein [Thermodesulfobacteriota bacterium]